MPPRGWKPTKMYAPGTKPRKDCLLEQMFKDDVDKRKWELHKQRASFFQNVSSNQQLPANRDPQTKFRVEKATILNDLSKERPMWALSAYGPGKDAPRQLFGGYPREQSFEEMRLHHMWLTESGSLKNALTEAQNMVRDAERQNQAAINDLDGATHYIFAGEHMHPNRLDICAQGSSAAQTQGLSEFAQPMSMPQQASIFQPTANPLNIQNSSAATSFLNPLRTSPDPVSDLNPLRNSAGPNPFSNPLKPATATGPGSVPNPLNAIAGSQSNPLPRLTAWHGAPVTYNKDDEPGYQDPNGAWWRIWFPDGAPIPVPSPTPESQSPAQVEQDNARIAAYASFRDTKHLEIGALPEVPPRRQSCQWDF